MFKSILPKEYAFFDYFDKHISLAIKISEELIKVNESKGQDLVSAQERISLLEKEMDGITQTCIEAIHKTFTTPIERTDIHALITELDDIADYVDGAMKRVVFYEVESIRPETKELAQVLFECTKQIQICLSLLKDMKEVQKILIACQEIHRLEDEGDLILRRAVQRLFKENDAVNIIKWKEIFEKLEKAIDRCEAVASIIEGVVIESV